MKKWQVIIATVFSSMFFSSLVLADSIPTYCPDANIIKETEFLDAHYDAKYNTYFAYQISKYKTPFNWGFVLGIPDNQASSKEDALNKAQSVLSTLGGEPKPVRVSPRKNQWYCLYTTTGKYMAVAITPIDMSDATLHTASQVSTQIQ